MSTQELFDDHADDPNDFADIPEADRLHPNEALCGLLKLASLLKDPTKLRVEGCLNSDSYPEVFLAKERWLVRDLTEDEAIYLLRCGIFFDGGVFTL